MKIHEKKAVVMFALTLLIASLVFVQVGFAQIGYAYIDPVETHVNVCEDFGVTVFAFVDAPIKAFEFLLLFDPTQMSVVNVMVIPPWIQSGLDIGPGYIWVAGIDEIVGPGPVPLADIVFHCDASGTSALSFDFVEVMDMLDVWWPLQWEGALVHQYDLYWKPPQPDYAPSGVPDFDQRQDKWINPFPPVGSWSYCGPTAVANSLWWLDSQFEPNPVPPPEINDGFPLVESYNPGVWDDHDPQNVPPLIEDLAFLMNTNNLQGIPLDDHCGTTPMEMQMGIDMYLEEKGLAWKFYEHTEKAPHFYWIEEQVEKCEDVILLLGFWQSADGVNWWRPGGHYVTVVGVDSTSMYIAVSDPFRDAAEFGGMGRVLPPGHGPWDHTGPPETLHNNATYVSHDIYHVGPSPSPGGAWGLVDYYAEEEGFIYNFDSCQNTPEEFIQFDERYNPLLPVYTEIEYAIIVSCETGRIAAGSEDGYVRVHDFYGNLLWNWGTEAYCVSVAFDNEARYLAGGWRYSDYGELNFFDVLAVTDGGWNTPLWSKSLVISESYDGGWAGKESKSVDVKYNFYNQYYIVAAAHDYGLNLYDQWGNLIWQYFDEKGPETIVRISQDGNYIVCADYNTGEVHYFSHLRDGVPGWGPADWMPIWNFGAGMEEMYAFWVAISGLGDYVAVSVYPNPVWVDPMTAGVVVLNRTGAIVMFTALMKGGYVRVDMPCDGRSVVSVNDDPLDVFGCDLNYFSDGGDGWDLGDDTPVWNYWPGKEIGSGQTPTHDFYTVSISENGDVIATGGADGISNVYVLWRDGTLVNTVGDGPTVQSVDLTFTGQYGVVGSSDGGYAMFDKDVGLIWGPSFAGAPIRSVAISKIYPCMFPFPNHDIAIIDVVTSKTGCLPMPTVGQGLTAQVNVTVENQGNFTETSIQVTVYANNTFVGTQTIPSLAEGQQIVLSFTWDTTGFPYGDYIINTIATIVQDEIDVSDNNFVDGVIKVVIPGDLDGNGKVNILDAIRLAGAFGTKPGDINWNPNADINGDGKVNILDAIKLAGTFGKSEP